MMCSRFKFYSYCRWTVPAVTHAELFYMYVWMLPPLDIYTIRFLFPNCWCYLVVGCARGHWIFVTLSTSFTYILLWIDHVVPACVLSIDDSSMITTTTTPADPGTLCWWLHSLPAWTYDNSNFRHVFRRRIMWDFLLLLWRHALLSRWRCFTSNDVLNKTQSAHEPFIMLC